MFYLGPGFVDQQLADVTPGGSCRINFSGTVGTIGVRRMNFPIVVTHPTTLFHKGLRQLFAKSRFRPVRLATSLTADLESYLGLLENGLWLTGVDKCISDTNILVRKVITANPKVKAVVFAASQSAADIVAALQAGARGFLCQDIRGETLVRSLELIAQGEMIVHPQFVWAQSSAVEEVESGASIDTYLTNNQQVQRPSHASSLLIHLEDQQTGDLPCLSRREMLILRMLMHGASNKVIARTLVITESTVKVHMKAILRKLRLQNRTQAAMWARNHVNESDLTNQPATASAQ
jgi:two-component system nitrate/nitrite response regulator NarL